MLKLGSDADVHGDIVRGLRAQRPDLDLVRVQDVGLRTAPDPEVLNWAGREGRVLISRDRRTMIGLAHSRVRDSHAMSGLIAVRRGMSIGDSIQQILLIAEAMSEDEIRDRVIFLPL